MTPWSCGLMYCILEREVSRSNPAAAMDYQHHVYHSHGLSLSSSDEMRNWSVYKHSCGNRAFLCSLECVYLLLTTPTPIICHHSTLHIGWKFKSCIYYYKLSL